jgi:hypothetical protein
MMAERTRRRPQRFAAAAPVLAAILLAGPACDGGSSSPTSPPATAFGAVGGSLTHLAIRGYNEIGGTAGWPHGELVEYGGGVIDVWAAEIGGSGPKWPIFTSVLAAEPATDRIWWQILVRRRPGSPPATLSAADQQLVREVAAEIGRLAPGLPVFASPLPVFGPGVGCEPVGETDERISRLMVDYAVSQGLAQRGPTLAPITVQNYNGPQDPCHQGPVGRAEHGSELRAFFGG